LPFNSISGVIFKGLLLKKHEKGNVVNNYIEVGKND